MSPRPQATAQATGIVIVNGNKAIAVVTDYSEGGDCTIKLDLAKVGLLDTVKPTDFESGEALGSPAPGQSAFNLRKHDFKAVLFE